MNKLWILFACLFLSLTTACTKCGPGASFIPNLVPRLSDATVALMAQDSDGDYGAYCTGVWVSENHILTAAHCVEDEYLIQFVTKDVEPELYEKPLAIYEASVVASDTAHDLALIKAWIPRKHERVQLAKVSPPIGSSLVIVGHTIGLTWTVVPGIVAAYRERLNYVSDKEGPWLETFSGMYNGNSGGGVFDTDGNLVGICSMRTPAPTIGFAVHLKTIRQFLVDNGV